MSSKVIYLFKLSSCFTLYIETFFKEKPSEDKFAISDPEHPMEKVETRIKRPGISIPIPEGGGDGGASTMCSIGVVNIISLVTISLLAFQ